MYILAIETTGAFASVALANANINCTGKSSGADQDAVAEQAAKVEQDANVKILAHVEGNDRFSHLQNLTPQIQQVIKESELSIDDIDAIAVSNGPGSFTGIRIGVSTARALSQVLKIPCIAVPSLPALAMRSSSEVLFYVQFARTLICPIIDARRSQVYGGGYVLDEQGYPIELIKAGPYMIEEFVDLIEKCLQEKSDPSVQPFPECALFTGDGIDAYGDRIKELLPDAAFAEEQNRYQDAQEVARLGAKLFAQGCSCSYDQLEPEYMRMAEAERKLRMKQAQQSKQVKQDQQSKQERR